MIPAWTKWFLLLGIVGSASLLTACTTVRTNSEAAIKDKPCHTSSSKVRWATVRSRGGPWQATEHDCL